MSSVTFDPSTRALCPDPSCIGVLDDQGVCPVCGRRGTPAANTSLAAPRDVAAVRDEAPEENADAAGTASALSPGEGFDAGRRLCPDGACLGVIGAEGRCNVCDRRAS